MSGCGCKTSGKACKCTNCQCVGKPQPKSNDCSGKNQSTTNNSNDCCGKSQRTQSCGNHGCACGSACKCEPGKCKCASGNL